MNWFWKGWPSMVPTTEVRPVALNAATTSSGITTNVPSGAGSSSTVKRTVAQALGRAPFEVGEELGAGAVAGPEQPEHGRRGHDRPGLADAAHDRAQVGRLDDDADALRLEPVLEELRDLLGEPLLDLEPARVHLDDARDLREPDHPAARDVGDRRRPEERQQVVLAERVERDVLDDDHLAVGDVEDRRC